MRALLAVALAFLLLAHTDTAGPQLLLWCDGVAVLALVMFAAIDADRARTDARGAR